jgi:hypothetical protein
MNINVKFIIREELTSTGESLWVAQGLERDIAVQAKSLDSLKVNLEKTLSKMVEMACKRREIPFARLGSAPQFYWNLWNAGDKAQRQTNRCEDFVAPRVCPELRFAMA